jgi:hypothetical protein
MDIPRIVIDTKVPFGPNEGLWNPGELEIKDDYVGKCIEGVFKNFNVFENYAQGEFIIVFGRYTRLMQFNHIIERI